MIDDGNIVRRRTVKLAKLGGSVIYEINVAAVFRLSKQDPAPDEWQLVTDSPTYADALAAADGDFGARIDSRRWEEESTPAGVGRAVKGWSHCGAAGQAALFYDAASRTYWVARLHPADEAEVSAMKDLDEPDDGS